MRLLRSRSRTAESAAFSRALAARELNPADRNPDDLAERLLGWKYRWCLPSRHLRRAMIQLLELVGRGMHLYHLARTRHFDAILGEELEGGTKQVVILSAGLDTRAHRFAKDLQGVAIYEVDLPHTSAWKQRLVQKRFRDGNSSVHYVVGDLASGDLFAALDSAGFRTEWKTFFLWEGASAYLPSDAVGALLRLIAARVPLASIAFDYLYRSFLDAPDSFRGGRRHMAMVRWAGEPYLFGCDPAQTGPFCASLGYDVVSNCDAEALAARHLQTGQRYSPQDMAPYLGIVHARARQP